MKERWLCGSRALRGAGPGQGPVRPATGRWFLPCSSARQDNGHCCNWLEEQAQCPPSLSGGLTFPGSLDGPREGGVEGGKEKQRRRIRGQKGGKGEIWNVKAKRRRVEGTLGGGCARMGCSACDDGCAQTVQCTAATSCCAVPLSRDCPVNQQWVRLCSPLNPPVFSWIAPFSCGSVSHVL